MLQSDFTTQAQEIISQMGGTARLGAMIGAHSFIRSDEDKYLSFKFKQKSPAKINYIKITLAPTDTYTVEFGYIRGFNYTVKETLEMVYADSLKSIIRDTIKLELTL